MFTLPIDQNYINNEEEEGDISFEGFKGEFLYALSFRSIIINRDYEKRKEKIKLSKYLPCDYKIKLQLTKEKLDIETKVRDVFSCKFDKVSPIKRKGKPQSSNFDAGLNDKVCSNVNNTIRSNLLTSKFNVLMTSQKRKNSDFPLN